MSDYFDASGNRISDGLTARATDVNTLRDEVGAAFDLIPDLTVLTAGTSDFSVDTGVVNAYLAAPASAPTSYTDGLPVTIRPLNTNTGASTINVTGLGVKSIKNASGSAVSAGDIVVGIPVTLRYSTTTGFFHIAPNSAVSAVDAAASAVAALASESAASGSASAASDSASSASSSASTATTQAGIATTKAGEAAADAISTAADAVSTAADAISTGADAIATAADRMQTGLDASTATTQAGNASTSASNASTSASNAATSASNAATAETNAELAETNAEAAQVAAEAAVAAIAGVVAAQIVAATGKPAIIDADSFGIVDSEAANVLKEFTWANLKTALLNTAMTWTAIQTLLSPKEVRTAPTIITNVLTLDLSLSNVFDVSLNAAITTLTISNPAASGTSHGFILTFTADGTARAVTWGASVLWPAATAPTLTSTNAKKDKFVFHTTDGGTTYHAFVVGQNL